MKETKNKKTVSGMKVKSNLKAGLQCAVRQSTNADSISCGIRSFYIDESGVI